MINPNNFQFDSVFTRLEQRVLDVLVEKHLFHRFIIHKPEGVDFDKLKKYRGTVSFVESIHFESLKEKFKAYSPRLVPSFSRAEEPCIHLVKPKINAMGYLTSTTRSKGFTSTHIIKQGHQDPSASALHKISMISLSVASIRLILPSSEFKKQFKKYFQLILALST